MTDATPLRPTASRTIAGVILHRLNNVKRSTVADAMHKDESTVSRIVMGGQGVLVEDLEGFLAAINLKIVDISQPTIDPEEFNACRALAKRYLTGDSEPLLSAEGEPS